jgi:hypothetical protein
VVPVVTAAVLAVAAAAAANNRLIPQFFFLMLHQRNESIDLHWDMSIPQDSVLVTHIVELNT